MDQEFVLWSQSLHFTLTPNSSTEPGQQLDNEDATWCGPEQQLDSRGAIWCGSLGKSSSHQKGLSWVLKDQLEGMSEDKGRHGGMEGRLCKGSLGQQGSQGKRLRNKVKAGKEDSKLLKMPVGRMT